MMGAAYFTSKGDRVDLGRELGRGGEGSVFEVPGLGSQVAKVYHKAPEQRKQDKLRFMASTADAQLLNYVAWPQETLHPSRGGHVHGFLMPKVTDKSPIHMVYSPAHRRQDYPKAAWDYLLFVARNIAASFETVNAHGHVIGDVNQNSFMVGRDSKVVLIDSDSFQVNAKGTLHLCEVGVAHFTPPELQALPSFTGFTRTPNHDAFGLALLIFHVLFGGRHPYSGVPLRSGVGDALETDIKAFRYAYARDNQSRGLGPPPRSIPLSMVPDPIEAMFHLAFTEKGSSGARPSAAQWVAALDGLRSNLTKCAASAAHVYPKHLRTCPWCDLERQGVVYFVDLGATVAPTNNGFVLTQAWALIQAVPAPQLVAIPSPASYSPKATPLPAGVPDKSMNMLYQAIGIGIGIAMFIAWPQSWLFALIVGWVCWWIGGSIGENARTAQKAARQKALEQAQRDYDQLVARAKATSGAEGFIRRKNELASIKDELEALPRAEKDELDRLQSTAQDRQKQKFLEKFFIDDASIPGVGPARKAALRSFGIETAADVTRNDVLQVRGFGEGLTQAVMDWKASCARRFVFNPAMTVSQSDRDAVRVRYAAKRSALERALAAGPNELRDYHQRANSQLTPLKPALEAAAKRLAQTKADMSVF